MAFAPGAPLPAGGSKGRKGLARGPAALEMFPACGAEATQLKRKPALWADEGRVIRGLKLPWRQAGRLRSRAACQRRSVLGTD